MPACTPLKLFISHSSRLDDVAHQYSDQGRNWRLLEETCHAIRERYGNRVEVLVDRDGLIPGADWNHCLNLWLAECHVAIILFSKRAIEQSDWVAKEAAILSWRAELDKGFRLIPVLLDGETTEEDLARDFFGALQIDKNQCIHACTAADILAGIVRQLGEPEALSSSHPQTPLERLQGGIAKLLGEETTTASLLAALEAVGGEPAPDGREAKERYADHLARELLKEPQEDPAACFCSFELAIDPLVPQPPLERARELLRYVRSLWVAPGAAATLPLALQHRRPLAMTGQFVTLADELLETKQYTLERYLERAWPGSGLPVPISVTGAEDLDTVKEEIRRGILGGGLPPTIDLAHIDQEIKKDPKVIILVVAAPTDQGGLPDPTRIRDLTALGDTYGELIVLFVLDGSLEPLPDSVVAVQPELAPEHEQRAFLGERAARTFLDQKYPNG